MTNAQALQTAADILSGKGKGKGDPGQLNAGLASSLRRAVAFNHVADKDVPMSVQTVITVIVSWELVNENAITYFRE